MVRGSEKKLRLRIYGHRIFFLTAENHLMGKLPCDSALLRQNLMFICRGSGRNPENWCFSIFRAWGRKLSFFRKPEKQFLFWYVMLITWLVEQDNQSSARRVIRCSGKSSATGLATFWDLLVTNVNFWWPSIHSIFNFISFSGTADQGGGFQKVLSPSIGYSGVEIEDKVCNGGSQKMKKVKKSIFSKFLAILIANSRKIEQNINKKSM